MLQIGPRIATVGFESQLVALRHRAVLFPLRFPRTAAFAATLIGGMVQACSLRLALCAVALSLLIAVAGCSSGGQTSTAPATSDARASRALSVFYQEFMSEHGGRPPQDEAEFRDFLVTRQERLDAGGLTADQLLTGPQGDQWIVGYGKPIEIEGRKFIAYSSEAAAGMHTVINFRGGTEKFEQRKILASQSR